MHGLYRYSMCSELLVSFQISGRGLYFGDNFWGLDTLMGTLLLYIHTCSGLNLIGKCCKMREKKICHFIYGGVTG